MGPEWVVVIAARGLLPLTIVRWPLFGGVVAFLADTLDVVLLELLGISDFGLYNEVDKALDTYYLALEAWTCLAWTSRLARNTALGLFAYRLVGVVLYEATANRALLFVFPNQFEVFFLAYLVYRRIGPGGPSISVGRLVQLNVGLLAIKEVQEYVLHVAQFPVYACIRDYVLIPLHVVGGTVDPWPATDGVFGAWVRPAREVIGEHQAALRAALPHAHRLGLLGRVLSRTDPREWPHHAILRACLPSSTARRALPTHVDVHATAVTRSAGHGTTCLMEG